MLDPNDIEIVRENGYTDYWLAPDRKLLASKHGSLNRKELVALAYEAGVRDGMQKGGQAVLQDLCDFLSVRAAAQQSSGSQEEPANAA